MTQPVYWRDIEDRQGNWAGLQVTVKRSDPTRPPLHLRAMTNGRIKLMHNDTPLLWATSERGYYGAWVVRNNQVLPHSQFSPVAPIRSADVDRYASLTQPARTKAWSRYFVSALCDGTSNFMSTGNWLAQGLLPDPSKTQLMRRDGLASWLFTHGTADYRLPDWCLSGQEIIDYQQSPIVRWLDWCSWQYKLIGLRPVDPMADRLKWWCKKSREGTLPPILLWYVAGLSAYVIIDGHYRLQAAIETNIPPSFIVLSVIRMQEFSPPPESLQPVVESLLRQRARNPGFGVDALNEKLINLFDNRAFIGPRTHSWAGLRSEQGWEAQVTAYLQGIGETEYLHQILEREE